MSENGDDNRQQQHQPQQGRRRGGNETEEKELASQQIQIQSKRFYIDVKENQRGRFIKLAEVGVGGRKSRILMTMSAASEFKTRLAEFTELHSQLGPSHQATNSAASNANSSNESAAAAKNNRDEGLIKSETIVKDRKRYYIDLKENQRGRFLRVSMIVPGGPRAQIAIPAQGLIEFKDHLSDMLERYGPAAGADEQQQAGSGGGAEADLPESKSFRADNKTFYFDCGSNSRGLFVKISEVRQSRYRAAITVPDKFLKQFRDQISEIIDKTESLSLSLSSAAAGTASAAATTSAATATAPTTEAAAPTATNSNNEKE